MSNPIDTLQSLGEAPNNSVFQGIVKNAVVRGITTSKWNVRSGGDSQTVFKGTQDQIVDVANSCQNLGYEYSIQGGHVWTITIMFPVDIIVNSLNQEPSPLTIWELNYHPVRQNLFEANDRLFVGKLSDKTKRNIDNSIKSYSVSKVDSTLVDISDSNRPYLSSVIARNLKRINVEGKNLFVPTLKRSAIFSNASNPTDAPIGTFAPWNSDTNGGLWTTAQLIKEYSTSLPQFQQIPQFIQDQLPETLPATIWVAVGSPVFNEDVIGYSMDQNGIVTFVGWLEYPVEYQTISLNKVQASQQWQFQKYSAGKYGLYDPNSTEGSAPEPNPSGPIGLQDGAAPG